jgi:cell fate regulator YaaT (PSP1 superfamily)
MPGFITPLPVMLDEEDRKIYDKLEAPKSIVVRYGYMKLVAELPYDGEAKPGCGSKLVVRTRRGIELAEMLTTTCPNSGCAQAVSRKDMLAYIDNSGGKDYPFTTQGKVLRVATAEDLAEQSRLDQRKMQMTQFTRATMRQLDLPMKLVDIEMLLGGERIIFHYTAEQWVDFRDLVHRLAQEYQTRIEMHQVNARDEARLVADYEKCGQYCCCKQFLKVLKPVSMKSAKVQKATLDPTKISGRCGRLMCCLRYEDKTYADLKQRLPHKQTRMMTEDGPGTVIGTQILTQLAMIRLDNGRDAAYPIENLTKLAREDDPMFQPRPAPQAREEPRAPRRERTPRADDRPSRERKPAAQPQPPAPSDAAAEPTSSPDEPKKRRRRRRRRRRKSDGEGGGGGD